MNPFSLITDLLGIVGAANNDAALDARIAELTAKAEEGRADYDAKMAALDALQPVEIDRDEDGVRDALS